MNASSRHRLPTLPSAARLLGLAAVVFATFAIPARAAAGPRFEVQGNGSIDAAASALSTLLLLPPAQADGLAKLMRQRATHLQARFDAANAALRREVGPLLTEAQRAEVPWPVMRWTSVAHWKHHLPDLTAPQMAALEPAIQRRNAAVRTALVDVQREYAEGLASLLNPVQREALVQVDGSRSVVYIPMR